jgi:hypothetical protein
LISIGKKYIAKLFLWVDYKGGCTPQVIATMPEVYGVVNNNSGQPHVPGLHTKEGSDDMVFVQLMIG